jgi:hypothetical protein
VRSAPEANATVQLTAGSDVGHSRSLEEEVEGASLSLPINGAAFAFETDLFKGQVMIRLADLPSSPAEYFQGKKRKLQVGVGAKRKERRGFSRAPFGRPC